MKVNIALSVAVVGLTILIAYNSQRPLSMVSRDSEVPIKLVQNSRANGAPGGQNDKRVSFKGVSFLIDETLAADVVMSDVAATPADDGTFRPDGIDARHLSFRFPSFSSKCDFSFDPEINVYKLSEYVSTLGGVEGYGEYLNKEIESLKRAVSEGSRSNEPSDYPFIPFVDATKILQARATKVEFENGRGLMYIAQFRPSDPVLVNNCDLVLIFQGISNDGKYFVSATFPVSASFLPDVRYGVEHYGYSIPDDFYERPELNERNYRAYLEIVAHQLDTAEDEQFSLRPSTLMSLFSSLAIENGTLDGC
jgi:hypothetical protein